MKLDILYYWDNLEINIELEKLIVISMITFQLYHDNFGHFICNSLLLSRIPSHRPEFYCIFTYTGFLDLYSSANSFSIVLLNYATNWFEFWIPTNKTCIYTYWSVPSLTSFVCVIPKCLRVCLDSIFYFIFFIVCNFNSTTCKCIPPSFLL